MKSGIRIGSALAWGFGFVVLALAPAVARAQAVPDSVTFTKHIAPILQRSCQNCHRPDGVAPMSLVTYEDVRPWARAIKTRTGIGPEGRRHAALVHREEHRHPALQERSVAQRSRRSRRSPNGPTAARRVATRADMPPAQRFAGRQRRGRSARPTSSSRCRTSSSRATRPTGGARFAPAPTGLDRRPLRRRARDQGSQRRAEGRVGPRHGRRTLRLPSHDLEHRQGRRRRRERAVAGARGRPQRRYLRPARGPTAQGRLEHRDRLGASPLERPRHQGAISRSASSSIRTATSRR